MILALDIGNTNITLGCFNEDKLLFISRGATDPSRMEDQYALELRDILDIYGVKARQLTGSIISSCVPSLTGPIRRAIEKISNTSPLVVGPGLKTGLNIRVENPASVGADLVVGCVAVLEKYPCPCIILDMGTATTFSVMDAKKNMLGGCIMPGVRISLDALSTRTAQLPQIGLFKPEKIIGANTVDCMNAGMVYGMAAMIDGVCDRIEEELGSACTVIATGGIARDITPFCKRDVILDENLLLEGLLILYKKNQTAC